MYNKRSLSKDTKASKAPKSISKPRDIIVDPMGQWKHPGKNTRIPSSDITMKGVPYPVLGVGSNGQEQMMYPEQEYTFPGADYVDEYPQMRKGGGLKSKKFSRDLEATNYVFHESPLFKKPKSKKKKIFHPKAKHYQTGGQTDEWGRPTDSPWYGFNPDTNKFTTSDPWGRKPGDEWYGFNQNTHTWEKGKKASEQKENEEVQRKRYESLYGPIEEKVLGALGTDEDFYNLPAGTYNTIQQIYGDFGLKRNIPPVDPVLKEMQKKLLSLPEADIQKLLNTKWTGMAGLANLATELPDNVSYKDLYRYYNHINKLKKQGYTLQTGGTTLTPEEEAIFQKFYNTLPDNLMSDDPTYDMRGYWDSEGRPEAFDYSQPTEDDGYYHAYSINGNTGEYLKSPAHETFQHAVDEDRKIGYRPITDVYGRNIVTENESIAEPAPTHFLNDTTGPVNYIDLELTPEEIQQYRDGGYVVEDLEEMQKGGSRKTIYVDDPRDPRLKAYNDSLDLYNSTALWEKALRQKGRKDISALSKIQGMNMGWGPYAFDKDVYKNIKPESVYTYNRQGQPWRVHKYKKPVQKVKVTNKVKDKVDKKPKHKVVDEVPEVPVTTIPQLALRPVQTINSNLPSEIIQAPVRTVPDNNIVPPASKEIWKTLPDGTKYRVERPVDPRLTDPVKIGFYKKGGMSKAQRGIIVHDRTDPRLLAYNDSLQIFNNMNRSLNSIAGGAYPEDVYSAFTKTFKEDNSTGNEDYIGPRSGIRMEPTDWAGGDMSFPMFDKPKRPVIYQEPIPQLPIRELKTTTYPSEIIPLPDYTAYPREAGEIVPPKSKEIWVKGVDGQPYRIERAQDPRLTKPVEIGFYEKGGSLLTKKVTCKKCGWTWNAADGGNDLTTCHKCGGKGLIHAQTGGRTYDKYDPEFDPYGGAPLTKHEKLKCFIPPQPEDFDDGIIPYYVLKRYSDWYSKNGYKIEPPVRPEVVMTPKPIDRDALEPKYAEETPTWNFKAPQLDLPIKVREDHVGEQVGTTKQPIYETKVVPTLGADGIYRNVYKKVIVGYQDVQGMNYQKEEPTFHNLENGSSSGFQKGGSKQSSLYIENPKEYAYRKAAYDDSLMLYKNNKEFIEAKEALVKADARLNRNYNKKNVKIFNKAQGLLNDVSMKQHMYHLEREGDPLLKGLVNVADRPVNTHYAFKNSSGFDRPVQHIYKKKKKVTEPKFERTMLDEVTEPPVNDFSDIRLPLKPIDTTPFMGGVEVPTPLNLGAPKFELSNKLPIDNYGQEYVSQKVPIYDYKVVHTEDPNMPGRYITKRIPYIAGYEEVGSMNITKESPTVYDLTKAKYQKGGITMGQEIDLSPEQEAHLRRLGYKLERI